MRFIPKFLRSDKSDSNDGDKTYGERHQSGDKKSECLCNVKLLDEHDFTITVKASSKGYTLLDAVLDHLELMEREYFGLRFIDHTKQTHWLDAQRSLSSQLKSSPPYQFYFGIKFYAADPCKLREEITRYQIFLQVKNDILQGRLSVTFDEAAELSAFTVQSELGDFDPDQHSYGYTSEFNFIPNQSPEFEDTVSKIHRQLTGIMPAVAEYKFLDKVKWLEMYGVDLHPVLGEGQLEYFLGLTPTGIVVYKNKVKVGNYFWPRILKVTHKGKIFIIKVKDRSNDEHSYAFETGAKVACKHLWKCCIEHHAFFSFRREQPSPKPSRPYPTQVYRNRSRRNARRAASESGYDGHSSMESVYNTDDGGSAITVVATLEPAQTYRHRSFPSLPRESSPQSVRSVPWESHLDGGLYTSGRDSPESLRSEKMKFPARRGLTTSSDTELASRKKYFTRRGAGSDNESDISVPRRRRRETDTSGSESESGYRRTGHSSRYSGNARRAAHMNGTGMNGGRDIVQGMEANSLPGYTSANQRRKRMTRSRSPPNSKRPPDELKKHFEYDLIETDGLSTDQLRDIPFVTVQTKAQPYKLYYDKARRRYRSPHRTQSSGETREKGIVIDETTEPTPCEDVRDHVPNHFQDMRSYTKLTGSLSHSGDQNRNTKRYQDGHISDAGSSHMSPASVTNSVKSHRDSPSKRSERSYVDVSAVNHHNMSNNNSIRSSEYATPDDQSPQSITSHVSTRPDREAYRNVMWRRYPSQTQSMTNQITPPSHMPRTSYSSTAIGHMPRPASKTMSSSHMSPRQQHNPQSYPSSASSKGSNASQQRPSSQAPHVQRPVYSWSHFQPVRNSPSPSQSTTSANLGGSYISGDLKESMNRRHRVAVTSHSERWTEL